VVCQVCQVVCQEIRLNREGHLLIEATRM